MNFGDKIRTLRTEKEMTQPELASELGIEQSYLSKLETGKSVPSNDVLNRLLDVFGIDLGEMLVGLDRGTRNQLRQIPDVARHLHGENQLVIQNRRRWLLTSACLLAFGIAFIYAGQVKLFFSDTTYQYISKGVIFEGEPKELFIDPREFVPHLFDGNQEREFLDKITARYDSVYMLRRDFRGDLFNIKVEGGSRTFRLFKTHVVESWQNKLVVFLGLLMAVLGTIGIVLERKLAERWSD